MRIDRYGSARCGPGLRYYRLEITRHANPNASFRYGTMTWQFLVAMVVMRMMLMLNDCGVNRARSGVSGQVWSADGRLGVSLSGITTSEHTSALPGQNRQVICKCSKCVCVQLLGDGIVLRIQCRCDQSARVAAGSHPETWPSNEPIQTSESATGSDYTLFF